RRRLRAPARRHVSAGRAPDHRGGAPERPPLAGPQRGATVLRAEPAGRGIMRAMRLATLALVVLPGCVHLNAPVPIEPGTNFTAHAEERNTFALDRLPDGRTGTVEAASWFNLGRSSPTYIVTAGHQPVAALWLTAPATVQVRADRSSSAPVVGSIEPSWEDNTIRLALRSGEAVFQGDVFQR